MKYWKEIVLLLAVIVGCAVGARLLNGSETLSDYARENPSLAYATASSEDTSMRKELSNHLQTTADNSASAISNISGSNISRSTVSAVESSSSDISNKKNTYRDGFYYENIPQSILDRIQGISYPKDCPVSLTALRYCHIRYIDFDGNKQDGEMICNKAIADDVMQIFSQLYDSGYQIESIHLIDDFGGDDEASMEADNTSCFNYRTIAGSSKISKHALGLAIDINPLYNPSVTFDKKGNSIIAPSTATDYIDRTKNFAYKISDQDLAYKLFTKHDFIWGGNWNSIKDYQHFEK